MSGCPGREGTERGGKAELNPRGAHWCPHLPYSACRHLPGPRGQIWLIQTRLLSCTHHQHRCCLGQGEKLLWANAPHAQRYSPEELLWERRPQLVEHQSHPPLLAGSAQIQVWQDLPCSWWSGAATSGTNSLSHPAPVHGLGLPRDTSSPCWGNQVLVPADQGLCPLALPSCARTCCTLTLAMALPAKGPVSSAALPRGGSATSPRPSCPSSVLAGLWPCPARCLWGRGSAGTSLANARGVSQTAASPVCKEEHLSPGLPSAVPGQGGPRAARAHTPSAVPRAPGNPQGGDESPEGPWGRI